MNSREMKARKARKARKVRPTWASFLLLALITLSSCNKDSFTLFDDKNCPNWAREVNVIFDWSQAPPEANPQQMSLYLFPVDEHGRPRGNGDPIRYDTADRNGMTIHVEPGHYHAICVNSDLRGTYLGGQTFDEFRAFTNENPRLLVRMSGAVGTTRVPRAEGTESERVVEQPDSLYSDSKKGFEVLFRYPKTNPPQELVLYPTKSSTTIEVEIDEVDHFAQVVSLGASLTGMARYIHLAGATPSYEKATFAFTVTPNNPGPGATGKLETLGANVVNGGPRHILVLYAIMNNGQKLYGEYDVTNQIRNASDPRHIRIYVPRIALPQLISTSSGPVSVEPWDRIEHIDLNL